MTFTPVTDIACAALLQKSRSCRLPGKASDTAETCRAGQMRFFKAQQKIRVQTLRLLAINGAWCFPDSESATPRWHPGLPAISYWLDASAGFTGGQCLHDVPSAVINQEPTRLDAPF